MPNYESYEQVIKWSDEYLIGDEKVDRQHKQLFKLVGYLIESCDEGHDSLLLHETLEFLILYTVQHFNDEETLQLRCNYPHYDTHKKSHEEFKATVLNFVEEFKTNGSSAELSATINEVVVNWLIEHVSKEDRKIAQYIK